MPRGLRRDTRLKIRGLPVVGVPDRDSLVVTGSDDPNGVLELSALTAGLHRSEAYAISSGLFIRVGERFEPLDTAAVDDSHCIPNPDVVDLIARKLDESVELALVIASPLRCEARSIYRLFRKLDAYLQYLSSPEFENECGSPHTARTRIRVLVHPASDQRMLRMIASLRGRVEAAQASLEVVGLGETGEAGS